MDATFEGLVRCGHCEEDVYPRPGPEPRCPNCKRVLIAALMEGRGDAPVPKDPEKDFCHACGKWRRRRRDCRCKHCGRKMWESLTRETYVTRRGIYERKAPPASAEKAKPRTFEVPAGGEGQEGVA